MAGHERLKGVPKYGSSRGRHRTSTAAAAAWLHCFLLAAMGAFSAAASRHIPTVAARPYTWAYFNIHPFSFTGVWNNQTYQADAWLRLICVNQTTHLARMVVSLHSAPFITVSPEGVHSLVPPELSAKGSSLPQLWFQSVDDDITINATQLTNYDELIKRHEDAAQLIYGAELPASMPFTLRMDGSERVHMVQRHCGPAQHPLFADGSVWLGMMDATTVTAAPNLKVHQRYQAERPPPAPASNPSEDAIKQAVLKALSSGNAAAAGGADAALLSLLTSQAAAVGVKPAASGSTGDDVSVITQLLLAGQEMEAAAAKHGLGSSSIAAAAMADNMQLMQLLAQQQLAQATAHLSSEQAAVAAGPAVLELLQQLAQKHGNADSISSADAAKMLELIRGEYASKQASRSGNSASPAVTPSSSGSGSSASAPDAGSRSSSSDAVLPQRTLLGRAGMLDSLRNSSSSSRVDNSETNSLQAIVTGGTSGASSSSSSSSGSSIGSPAPADQEPVYFPFTPGSNGSSSSSSASSSVDPAVPLPPSPPSKALLSGDSTDAWATHHSSSSSTGADVTSGSNSNSSSGSSLQMGFWRRGEVLRFLTLQHLQHHRSLGFAGSIMVVTRHTAEAIMQSRPLRRAMQRQRLILVLWDLGLEPRASHFMQVPAYNLMRLAAWGSKAHLGFWDLDEYLVLPSHKTISEEINSGCLSGTLSKEPEAIVPTMWVSSNSWNATPELVGWMRHGYWSRAVQAMDYAMWPYTFCDGACKALVNPTSDLMFQVHQHARPPPRPTLWPVSWRCSYLLHFYQLWSRRMPALMSGMGYQSPPAIPGIPLLMEDILPQSALQRLASMAKLYKEIIASNPSLQEAAEADVTVQQQWR